MEWYEWVFDGVGTTVIAAICSFVSYKAAIKQIGKQSQIAGDISKQKQEMVIEGQGDGKNVQDTIKQSQKAGSGSEQVQIGRIKQ